MIGGIGSGVMFWLSNGQLIWLGVLLTTLPLPFFLMVLTNILKIARSSDRLPLIQLLSISGVTLVGIELINITSSLSNTHYIALALTIFGAGFIQWFIRIFSTYGRKKSKHIVKGEKLPNLQFTTIEQKVVESSSFEGSQILFVFFRANWCPFCMNQLKEVIMFAQELKQLGVKVKFISNQGIMHSAQLAQKLDLPEHFEILQDDGLSAARALGIEDIGGTPIGMSAFPEDTVMATVIATNENGIVMFGDETDNYRKRPHPNMFMPVFDKY